MDIVTYIVRFMEQGSEKTVVAKLVQILHIRDPATELQGSYTATQQDQAIGTVLMRVVIRVKSRA
jgi:hypothetical protein